MYRPRKVLSGTFHNTCIRALKWTLNVPNCQNCQKVTFGALSRPSTYLLGWWKRVDALVDHLRKVLGGTFHQHVHSRLKINPKCAKLPKPPKNPTHPPYRDKCTLRIAGAQLMDPYAMCNLLPTRLELYQQACCPATGHT